MAVLWMYYIWFDALLILIFGFCFSLCRFTFEFMSSDYSRIRVSLSNVIYQEINSFILHWHLQFCFPHSQPHSHLKLLRIKPFWERKSHIHFFIFIFHFKQKQKEKSFCTSRNMYDLLHMQHVPHNVMYINSMCSIHNDNVPWQIWGNGVS